tara:strand:+ start:528 stop:746 length:219 start_codon:yes stop_codon:yes gene_type:complete
MYVVTFSLAPNQSELTRVIYKHQNVAEDFKNDMLKQGCKAMIKQVKPADLPTLDPVLSKHYEEFQDFYNSCD